jgi:adenylate cyclase
VDNYFAIPLPKAEYMKVKDSIRVFRRHIILPFVILCILAISYLRWTDIYELQSLDMRFSLRPKTPATDKVALIEIGDDTLKNLGQWPIERNYHALIIKALAQSGANKIILDIFFTQSREYDDNLEEAIHAANNVYLPYVFDIDADKARPFTAAKGYDARNLADFSAAAKGEGHINISPDIDGKFRRVPLLIEYEGKRFPYLAFLAACDYLGLKSKDLDIKPARLISCGGMKIPLDDHSNMIVNFSGKWSNSYRHYSYYDVLQSYLAPAIGQKPILDLNVFKDKICVIGLTATGTVDLHPSPLETLYPAFGIHAEVINSMLNRHFISRASKEMNLAILILLMTLAILITLRMRPIAGLLLLVVMELLFWAAAILVFNLAGIWIDLFYPTLTLVFLYLSLTLYKYIAEWRKRIVFENELSIAKQIQESFLPLEAPRLEGIDIATAMFTARQVGGDLYDFRRFDDDKLGVMIGDVSGKGMPASLFMAKVTSEFKFFAQSDIAPQKVLRGLNSKLSSEPSSNLFVTMFYLIFDRKRRMIQFSNGGHLPVIHLNQSGEAGLLDVSEGTPLGLLESSYGEKEIPLIKGDSFVLYTDGVTEAMNSRRELYGEGRLINVIKSSIHLPSKGILDAVEKDVRRFEPKSMQHDDITIVVIKII